MINLNSLINSLEHIQGFAFLKDSIKLRQALRKYALDLPKISRPKGYRLKNAMFVKNKYIYNSNYGWNRLYQALYLSKNRSNISHYVILLINMLSKKNIISPSIRALINIHVSEYEVKSRKLTLVQKLLKIYLTNTIAYALRNQLPNYEGNGLKLTYTSEMLGTVIYHFFISIIPVINKLLIMFNPKITFTVIELSKLYSLLDAIIEDNEFEYLIIYNELINTRNNTRKDKKKDPITIENSVLTILNTYIINIIFDLYDRKNKNILPLINHLENKSINNKDFQRKKKKYSLLLGADIIVNMEEVGILERRKISFKKRALWVIKFPDKITQGILKQNLSLIPYFTANNREFIINKLYNIKSNEPDKLMPYHISKFIHSNEDMTLTINEECYLSNSKPLFKYTIDQHYLKYMLTSLKNIFQKEEQDIFKDKDYIFFFLLYNIDIQAFSTISKEDTDYTRILIKILYFALDLNTISDKEIRTLLKALKSNKKHVLTDMLNKISNQKIYIINLMKDAVRYSLFKYFMYDGFIDTRGRFYNNSIYTNIQNFPLSKILVKQFSGDIRTFSDKAIFAKTKKVFENYIKNSQCKTTLNNIDINKYKEEDDKLTLNYIYDFFNSTRLSYSALIEFLSNQKLHYKSGDTGNILLFVKKYIKKLKRALIAHSHILLYLEKSLNRCKYIQPHYELDATASGLQMTSILLNSAYLGRASNLIGSGKTDIYKEACIVFNDKLHIMDKEYKAFIENTHLLLEDTTTSELTIINADQLKSIKTLNAKLNWFLKISILESPAAPQLINQIYDELKYVDLDINNIILQSWWLSTAKIAYAKSPKITVPRNFYLYMMILKEYHYLNSLCNKEFLFIKDKQVFNNRELFKNAVMTYFYNSTSFGRKDDFMDFLRDEAEDNIILNAIGKQHLSNITVILDNFFLAYIKEVIPDSVSMFKLSEALSKNKNKEIIIKNKFFAIAFGPHKTDAMVIQTNRFKGKRGAQLTMRYPRDEIDGALIRQRFSPNLIHSMDAYIVHAFMSRILSMNEEFKKHKFTFELCCYTNHDTFGMWMKPYLKLLIEDCYHELIEANYITCLTNLDPDVEAEIKSLIPVTKVDDSVFDTLNPHFVK